jgi:glutathione synthase/RimK-type ligase-like ATP-grasp enzyme
VGGLPFINDWLTKYQSKWEGKFNRTLLTHDMIYCLHRYGISFQDYWIYEFPYKSNSAREDFVSDKLRYHYCDILNDDIVLPLTTDKYSCYKRFKQFFKRDVLGIYTNNDFDLFEEFTKKHSSFIFKPLNEHSGKGIELISTKDIDVRLFFENKLSRGSFVVEEVIQQGEEVAKMHSACINSFRVVTFRLPNNDVKIIGVTWRIGSGNSVMDNAGAGGMFAVVNPELGYVETSARRYNTEEYYIHPDSGVIIPGFQLPKWEEAKEMIKNIALSLPEATMISWDLCYSNKGWMMIEANDNGDWSIIQSNKKIGLKPYLYSLMDKHFNK